MVNDNLCEVHENISAGIFTLSNEKNIINCNRQMELWLAVSNNKLLSQAGVINILDCIETEDLKLLFSKYFSKAEEGKDCCFTCKFKTAGFEGILLEVMLMQSCVNDVKVIVGVARKVLDNSIKDNGVSFLGRSLAQLSESVVITDKQGLVEYVNDEYERKTGYHREFVIGEKPAVVSSGQHSERFYKNMWDTIKSGKVFKGVLKNRKKNGNYYYEEKIITPIKNTQGDITHYISTGRDITRRLQRQGEIDYLAYHDSMTGFHNRRYLEKRLKNIFHMAKKSAVQAACLYIDLDDFKSVNDMYGHECGDLVLKAIAKRIVSCTRKNDILSRIGGDEFFVVMPELKNNNDASLVAEKIINKINQNININGIDLSLSVSVGIALIPDHGVSADVIIKNSDIAMYHSKETGKNRYSIFNKNFEKAVITTEIRLIDAIKKNDFSLRFHPVYDVEDNNIFYIEALLRWRRDKKFVPPFCFISVAEKMGLMQQITKLVLNSICKNINDQAAIRNTVIPVSINLPAQLLQGNSFINELISVVDSHDTPAENIIFEISENQLSSNIFYIKDSLQALHEYGFKLVLDNYGSGNLAVNDLRQLPFDMVKIDRSFLAGIPGEGNEEALITALIDLVLALNFKVIVHGVETDEHVMLLKFLGCRYQQGYYYSRPLGDKDIAELFH